MRELYVETVFVFHYFDTEENYQMRQGLKERIVLGFFSFLNRKLILLSDEIAPVSTIASAIKYCV